MVLQPVQIKSVPGVPGIQITQTVIRKSSGGFTASNVIALFVLFEHKDQVKDWVKENDGSWQPVEKYWYVPFQSEAELLSLFSKIGSEIPDLVSALGETRLFDSGVLSDRLVSALQSAFEPSAQESEASPEASDNWLEKEDKISAAVEAEAIYLGDDSISEVDLYAVIQEDGSVEVVANQTGMGHILPKQDRKYIGGKGNLRWRYPRMTHHIRRAVDLVLDHTGEKA